jgi:diaminopimelate epimerase
MLIKFVKYQGAGNDFVIVDHRIPFIQANNVELIALLCHRKFGIGADGLILLENSELYNFKMVYFNADGHQSSMCGNGGRCIARFAQQLGMVENHCTFEAVDGMHEAYLNNEVVKLKMNDVSKIEHYNDAYILNTGSPHFVDFMTNVSDFDVPAYGRKIRNSEAFVAEGINVNFVEKRDNSLYVRTYERGVEDETLACGTGVTACAIAYHHANQGQLEETAIQIETPGGHLKVYLSFNRGVYHNIWLEGNATAVFDGTVYI